MGVLAFLVKFPMYFVHLWLPKAHVEAPVSGSIILAGVLLKLGGYGIIRLIRVTNIRIISSQIIALALIGGGILGVLCIVQRDIKVVIAYSSVVHIALVIAGRLRLTKWGFEGVLTIISLSVILFSSFFSAAYRLILYRSTNQGQTGNNNSVLIKVRFSEMIILISHRWRLLFLCIFMYMV